VIGFLRGRLAARQPPTLLLDVGGVGYELEAPMSTFYELPATGSEITLLTHLVVREDAHLLYGFASERERTLFRELIKVSNVGPRIALAILSGMRVEEFQVCIETQDASALVRIPGIGRKTAERLVVDLRDRLGMLAGPEPRPGSSAAGGAVAGGGADEAYGALLALGYRPAEAVRMLKNVDPGVTGTEERIRQALRAVAAR
jgi:Holliday junction DNA helicase RuvA